ncbi:hypothetical protein FIBSPDRAFT_981457 [Athelia psychrophila]|uniref:Uncharacterized protein n=1 Tax=Athelia psychrophila TaxID=1759441 RepID=A0A166CT74_9AGAM|nr:hypothetical protein FIBSPDRAFT_981457 [Fibularhizoctonia sp. CBS 109695]
MDASPKATDSEGGTRGRGRGNSRGGLGKYLRARGRGRGGGRPAVFGNRLLLEDEQPLDLDPESEEGIAAREYQQRFSRRQLGSNADRYAEPTAVLNSDGEEEVEPEVDLSSFLERQRLSEASPGPSSAPPPPEEEEVDETLAHISSRPQGPALSKKGKVQTIEWDDTLDEMTREKAAAEATWDLKTRFRAKTEKLRVKPTTQAGREQKVYEAPLLPSELAAQPKKDPKHEMEDFLDDLLG